MKYLFPIIAFTFLLFSSCKKEMKFPTSIDLNDNSIFFETIKLQLKDSLSLSDYLSLDTAQMFKSKDAQGDGCFVRMAVLNKNIATDFILLKTDSLGNIRAGKMIHVDKSENTKKGNNHLFQGRFIISSLNGKQSNVQQVVDGKRKQQTNVSSMMEQQEPVGEQELPDVVVTSYSTEEGYTSDWYWYGGLIDDYGSTSGTYTYGSAGGGGGGSSSPSSHGGNDNTITIEIEPNDDGAIKVEDYVKCFSSVPDANATYQIKLYADIPVDGDASKMFNWATGSPGHSFVQLIKTSGAMSVQQNFGFYPRVGWKTLGNDPTEGKVVDNGGHEYNASLTQTLNPSQFQATIDRMESLQTVDYDIITWNCTDFALSVFNASTSNPLTIPRYFTEGSDELMNTPQALYTEIQLLQASGNTTHGTPSVPSSENHAGTSHGSCGQ